MFIYIYRDGFIEDYNNRARRYSFVIKKSWVQKYNWVFVKSLIEQVLNYTKNWRNKVIAQKTNIYIGKKKINR